MSLPLVSVIIPTYNYASFIENCIKSVLNQSYRKIEIIVVNDGSTDNTLALLKKFSKKITVHSQKNSGVSAARNAGLEISNGEFIAFLDADDWWEPTKVQKQIESMIKSKSDIAYCFYLTVNKDRQAIPVFSPEINGSVKNLYQRFPLTSMISLPCSTGMVRKKHLGQQRFNTKLNNSADWEFFARVSQGAQVTCVPEFLTYYRIHQKSMSNRTLHSYYKQAIYSYYYYLKYLGFLKLDYRAVTYGSINLLSSIFKDIIKSVHKKLWY